MPSDAMPAPADMPDMPSGVIVEGLSAGAVEALKGGLPAGMAEGIEEFHDKLMTASDEELRAMLVGIKESAGSMQEAIPALDSMLAGGEEVSEDLEVKMLLAEIITLEDTAMGIDVDSVIEHIKALRGTSIGGPRLTAKDLRAVRDTLLAADTGAQQPPTQQDVPELDGMLKGLMDFEAKLFGEEDEGKLKAFISELQSDEAGHNEEVKDSIKQLEAYRATLTAGAGMPIPKEEADRMILLAEIFTSMIASAPADVVVESIKAMKALGEQPSVEQLEQVSKAMLATLGNPEYDMPEPADDAEVDVPADDMPTDEPVDVADDMPTDEPVDVGDDTSGFEKYKLPLIIVGSVLSGVLATLGAVAGIKFSRRNAASKSNYADMQNAESVV